MATGHSTYSTVHADSAKSLIHRLEGKPIEIPRVMLQSLDIVSIHITTRVKGKRVRRCKQIIEIIDIDSTTKEILTNEVFRWDPVEDKFIYTGKSYILEGIRARWELSKEQITKEIRDRATILEWMKDTNVRTYKEVAKAISRYTENPQDFMNKIKNSKKSPKEILEPEEDAIEKKNEKDNANNENPSKPPPDKKDTPVEKKTKSGDKTQPFNDLASVDVETAIILEKNNIKTIEELQRISLKELAGFEGIKKKTAKNIKKELENKFKDVKDTDTGGEEDAVK
jgi:hypothetical protein